MNNKSKLKIMATSLALSAASGGAWGNNSRLDLDPSGTLVWGASRMKVNPAFGLGQVPLDGSIITEEKHTFSVDKEPIVVMKFRQSDSFNAAPSVNRKLEQKTNLLKSRGIFSRGKLALQVDDKITDFTVALIVQPLPEGPKDLFLRPEFAFFPALDISERKVPFDEIKLLKLRIDAAEDLVNRDIIPGKTEITLDNVGFCSGAPEPFKIIQAGQYKADSYISFASYVRIGSRAVLTYHILPPFKLVQRIRCQIRLAALCSLYDEYASVFKSIYATDATAIANLAALIQTLKPDSSAAASSSTLEGLLQEARGNMGTKCLLEAMREQPGPRAFMDYFYAMNDDFTQKIPSSDPRHKQKKMLSHLNLVLTIF
jgi:hypothetical protein